MSSKAKAKTLLLDMDGVLAEVSKSYRSAIVATCRSFGATSVSYDTILEWKARGGCNNDWVLSYDLIKNDPLGKQDVTLQEVTDVFETLYQGDHNHPGLYTLETLIPAKATLEKLRDKCGQMNMAIVTGRPRKDCFKFLQDYAIDQLFDVCVCMEDGPPKPNPFPILRALDLLGVQPSDSVIMVGDTPDDVRSALAAGCRAVGVATPENFQRAMSEGRAHDTCTLTVAMKECGAEIILKPGFEELLEFF
jgi:HAD superfamily hydrolase (TIGR01548 family)